MTLRTSILLAGLFLVSLANAQSLSGTYSVGKSTGNDFSSVQAGVTQLMRSGQSGDVVFEIEDGTYPGRLFLPENNPNGTQYSLSFIGKSRDSSKVILKSTTSNVVYTNRASYVNFKHLTVEFDGSVTGFDLRSASHHFTISNCLFKSGATVRNSARHISNEGKNILIENTAFLGGGERSIFCFRTSEVVIRNCKIWNFRRTGIGLTLCKNYEVYGNYVDGSSEYYGTGVRIHTCDSGVVYNNQVYNCYTGFQFESSNQGNDTTWVYNNVAKTQGWGNNVFYSNNLYFHHNVFQGDLHACRNYGVISRKHNWQNNCKNIHYQNNQFISDGGYIFFWTCDSCQGAEDTMRVFDHNNLFSPTTPNSVSLYINHFYTDSTVQDSFPSYYQHTTHVDPEFEGFYDFTTHVAALNNKGKDVGVKFDIHGKSRPNSKDTQVDIGVNDYYLYPSDLDIADLVFPVITSKTQNTLTVKLRNGGTDTLKADTILLEYSLDSGKTWHKDTLSLKSLAPDGVLEFEFAKKWAVKDLKGNEISVRITQSVKNDPDADDRKNFAVCAPLWPGKYKIGKSTSADFADIKSAVERLNECGTAGKLVFEIETGVYLGHVLCHEIMGVSSSDSIIFRGVGRDSVFLKDSGTVLTLDGTDYISFENMTFICDTSGGTTVKLLNDADHNTFKNCRMRVVSSQRRFHTLSTPFALSLASYSGWVAKSGSYNTIENCLMEGGIYSMYVTGSAQPFRSRTRRNVFRGNKFSGSEHGVRIFYQDSLDFVGNTIDHNSNDPNFTFSLYLSNNWNAEINANHIGNWRLAIDACDDLVPGISLGRGTRFVNNMVFTKRLASMGYNKRLLMANNTFSCQGDDCLYTYASEKIDFTNNIIVYSGDYYGLFNSDQSPSTFSAMDYNNYWLSSSQAKVAKLGKDYKTIQDLVGVLDSSFNRNNLSINPQVKDSLTDLHLKTSAPIMIGKRIGVALDYDGDKRCLSTPTMGADEVDLGLHLPKANFAMPDTVCVKYPTLFESTTTGFYHRLEWRVVGDTSVDTGKYFSPKFETAGSYTVKLKAINQCSKADSVTRTVVAKGNGTMPPASFTASGTKVNVGDTVDLASNTLNKCGTSTKWIISPNTFVLPNSGQLNDDNIRVIFTQTGVYSVTLIKANSLGADTLVKLNHITVLNYCKPTVLGTSADVAIAKVDFNTISNSSTTGVDGYNDFRSISTKVDRGSSYTLTLERATNKDQANYRAWIDWNSDGDFDDPKEMVLATTSIKSISTKRTVKIPVNASPGQTRMRVGIALRSATNTTCGSNNLGEYEDYTIIIANNDAVPPTITLKGALVDTIRVGTSWLEPGFTAMDLVDGLLKDSVVVSSALNVKRVGVYQIQYSVKDKAGNTANASRTIHVIDDVAPTIKLLGLDSVWMEVNTQYIESGVLSTDNYDAKLTVLTTSNLDTSLLGTYKIEYCVTDSSGNGPVCTERIVVVGDTTSPVVSLIGSTHQIVGVYTTYTDSGITAYDNDGYFVSTSGTWQGKTDSIGAFSLIYTVIDNARNTTVVTRQIHVVDTTAPVIKLVGLVTDTIVKGTAYMDAGYTLSDNYDDSAQVTIQLQSNVDTSKAGTYFYTYLAEDLSGNKSQVTRTVVVIPTITVSSPAKTVSHLMMYPNPSTGLVTFTMKNAGRQMTALRIYDATGVEVMNSSLEIPENGSCSKDLSGLSAGVYLVEVINQKHRAVKYLTILK